LGESLNLGGPPIDDGTCADPQRVLSQIASVIDALGNPGPAPGPGPIDPETGEPIPNQGIPVDLPYTTRLCLTSNYTNGVATGQFVDDKFQPILSLGTIDVPDPTRRIYREGTVAGALIPGGAESLVFGTDTNFPEWVIGATLSVGDGLYPVTVYDTPIRIRVSGSLDQTFAINYSLKENIGQLEGTGDGTCGTYSIRRETPAGDSGGDAPGTGPTYVITGEIGGSVYNVGIGAPGGTYMLVDGLANALILPGEHGSVTLTDEPEPLLDVYNATGRVIWKDSYVLVDGNGYFIINTNASDILSAVANIDEPTLHNDFDSWSHHSHNHYDATGDNLGIISDPLSILLDAKLNDTVMFSVQGDRRVAVSIKPSIVEITVISEITGLSIDSDGLKLSYKKRTVWVHDPEIETPEEVFVPVAPCEVP
jgi:hypothetical protein